MTARLTRRPAFPGLLLVLCLLSGCAGNAEPQPSEAADAGTDRTRPSVIAVYDPYESFNRRMYKFNAQADRYVLVPVVDAYADIVPWPIRDRVSDFFRNIGNLVTFANQVLQLKFPEAGKTALRFGTNTLLGMFGIVDLASAMGMPQYDEDFGQTLGYWGAGDGAFLILPILGPSNVRDAAGKATDAVAYSVIDPFGFSSLQTQYPPIMAADVVNARYSQPFRYFETGSPFEYDLIRFGYTKKRQIEIGRVIPLPPATAPAGAGHGAPSGWRESEDGAP